MHPPTHPVETQAHVDAVASAILSRGLAEPAIFLLEMGKPLVGCLREVERLSHPLVTLLLGSGASAAIETLLADGQNVERVISALEVGLQRKSAPPSPSSTPTSSL